MTPEQIETHLNEIDRLTTIKRKMEAIALTRFAAKPLGAFVLATLATAVTVLSMAWVRWAWFFSAMLGPR